tara:strand:- start:785 stop:1447 length:663 start_codon:yes stop_codon:yes gene_type:complete
MNHTSFSEKEIVALMENFKGLQDAIISIENKLKSELNYEKNICGFFMADFSALGAWYASKYYFKDGNEDLINANTGATNVAFSYPDEVYKNFRDGEIIELIEKNKFNKNQIYIKLSFEKFYVRKTLLGAKCAYRAGLIVEKIKTPYKIVEVRDYDRFKFEEENEDTTTLDNIRKGYIVSDDFKNILHDIKIAFLYCLSEVTQDKLLLIDEQSSINNLGNY